MTLPGNNIEFYTETEADGRVLDRFQSWPDDGIREKRRKRRERKTGDPVNTIYLLGTQVCNNSHHRPVNICREILLRIPNINLTARDKARGSF